MSQNIKTNLVERLAGRRATREEMKTFYDEVITAGLAGDAEILADIMLNFQWYIEQRCINAHLFAAQQAARNCRANDYVNPTFS